MLFPRCVKVGPDTANPTAATKNTVCTSTRPFKLHVHSDSVEFGNPAADGEGTLANNRGFSIGKKKSIFNCYPTISLFYSILAEERMLDCEEFLIIIFLL